MRPDDTCPECGNYYMDHFEDDTQAARDWLEGVMVNVYGWTEHAAILTVRRVKQIILPCGGFTPQAEALRDDPPEGLGRW